jgi:hypothetical protein
MNPRQLLTLSITVTIVVGNAAHAAADQDLRFSTQALETQAASSDGGLRTLLHLQLDRTGTRDIVYASGRTLEIFYNPQRRGPVSHVARFEVDGNLRGVVAGDFDGDAFTDLAVISHDTGRIQVLSFDARGRFLRERFISAGPRPQSVIAADLNRDGRSDLAITYAIEDERDGIATLINEGKGVFRRSAPTPIGRAPFGLVAVDLDLDGSIDLAAANALSDTVSILLNNGAGGFPAAVTYPAGDGPWDLAAADLNRDGLADLVVTNAESLDVSVMLGVGGGVLAPHRRFAANTIPVFPPNVSLALGDLSGDGFVDVLLSNGSMLPGTGDGGLGAPVQFNLVSNAIALAHLDGDGRLDAVVDRAWTEPTAGVLLAFNRALASNRPPVPIAADVAVTFGEWGLLDARGSFDPDGHLVGFAWHDELGRPLGDIPTQSVRRMPGEYAYTVTVSDSLGAASRQEVRLAVTGEAPPYAEVVLHAADAAIVRGSWRHLTDASAASGTRLVHPNADAEKLLAPLANPADYVELTFDAHADAFYQLWIRGRAERNSWKNDSAYVQFSSTVDFGTGSPRWRIGTTDGLIFSLEPCVNCGVAGWGWNTDGIAPFTQVGELIRFERDGPQTIRIQTREDGLSIDQIVLSSVSYLGGFRPGAAKRDTIVLPKTQ